MPRANSLQIPYVVERRGLLYFRVTVPPDVRHVFGKGSIERTLGTADREAARLKAARLKADHDVAFAAARRNPEATIRALAAWRSEVVGSDLSEDQKNELLDAEMVLDRELDSGEEQAAWDVVRGRKLPMMARMDDFLAGHQVIQRTKDDIRKAAEDAARTMPDLLVVRNSQVVRWLEGMDATTTTRSKRLSFLSAYCRWLVSQDNLPKNPFAGIPVPKRDARPKTKRSWFRNSKDVAKLWNASIEIGDKPLADMILICAYTGMRIEEAARLQVSDLIEVEGIPMFNIRKAKTDAGVRQVPIHPAVLSTVKQMAEDSKDGYLIAGLEEGRQGRSGAVGKRFGRLKKKLSFGRDIVFHSLRHTVVTQLENADVATHILQDIVGHEREGTTHGRYGHGSSATQKLEAIKKINYDGFDSRNPTK